ncbi:hypothetical protein GGX14DRAFT_698162 [Mycena pura]|uniref:ER transporter 6TM N-terminal domain-containing protein n=1 Tax=Mycena pura TaxID=153505 RepID=A0AAD6VAV2_9AGAR|nr:hypothetical protein GGX14DRAFT_698162 [Mycena pura]
MSAASNDSETEAKTVRADDATDAPASEVDPKEAGADAAAAKDIAPGPAGGFFSWILPALKTPRTHKTWVRCIFAFAGSMVLLVCNASLRSMGQAAFFAGIVAFMLPPSLALSLFMFASLTLLFGMLLGWAWGAAAMAAALSVQDKALLASRLAAAQKAIAGAGGPVSAASLQAQLESLAFHGYFLDGRSSAVYGAFLFIGTFAMGAIRARSPRLVIFGVFATTLMDVMCLTGPLLPTQQYTLAKIILLPTCYYLAIAIASLVLIFPESLNHVWLTTLDNAFFGPATGILSLQSEALHTHPSDYEKWAAGAAKTAAARAGLGAGLVGLSAQIGLIDLEISVGRLGPGDLKRFALEVRALGVRVSGLHAFQTAVSNVHADDERDAAAAAAPEGDKARGAAAPMGSAHETRFARRRRLIAAREAAHGHALDDLVPILAAASEPLRTAAEEGMAALRAWFADCNGGRWMSFLRGDKDREHIAERQKGLAERRDALQQVLGEWRREGRARLIKPYEKFFDEGTGKLKEGLGNRDGPEMFAVRSLFICFVFCDTLDAFAARLHRVLILATDLDARRPRPRIWLPSGFGKVWRKLVTRAPAAVPDSLITMGTLRDPTRFDDADTDGASADGDDTTAGGAASNNELDEEPRPAQPGRNPNARAPTSTLGKLCVRLGAALRFFKTPEGIFALRNAVLSVALWVPQVVPSTAWFYYSNKGLWALIMAQLSLAPFAGDQLLSIATRFLGTALGLLLGMVVWYIAAPGLGNGNPYAVVVVTTLFLSPLIMARIAAPLQQSLLWIMTGVTAVLVVGYSWLDRHLIVVANQGVGIGIGWRRALLVVIGFVAAGIIMLFPRPSSSRTLVRRTLAATLEEMGNIFGKEVEAFLAEEARARAGPAEKEEIDCLDEDKGKVSPKERRARRVAARIFAVLDRLRSLAPSLRTARWEPQIHGLWPHEQYASLHAKELKFATSLALLTSTFSKLDTTWCSILVHRTPFLNPNLLSDVFQTIDTLSHALEAGRPIPASLPLLRERLLYHEALIRALAGTAPNMHGLLVPEKRAHLDQSDDELETDSHAAELVAGKVDGASIGFEELSLSVLMDEQLPTHSTAVIALASILTVLDEIAAIVRELCGETTFRGFDALHHEFQGREEAAIGTRSR